MTAVVSIDEYLGLEPGGFARRLDDALDRPCILCGAEPNTPSVYFSWGEQAERMGARPDKLRAIFYAICGEHPLDDETVGRCEQILEVMAAWDS
jgi:hypothetical protein